MDDLYFAQKLEAIQKDVQELSAQITKLEASVAKFVELGTEHRKLQAECMTAIAKQKKSCKSIAAALEFVCELPCQRLPPHDLIYSFYKIHYKTISVIGFMKAPGEQKAELTPVLDKQKLSLSKMEKFFPQKLSFLLETILGSVNITFPAESDRLKYKTEYESYKLQFTWYIIFFSALCCVVAFRELDAIFQLLLVTFYCTVTMREHILIANGSKILKWWLVHHYLAIVLSVILLTWPSNTHYDTFRFQFMLFSFYLGAVQVIQHKYQAAVLYKKRALGLSDNMEITSDVPTPGLFFWVIGFSLLVYVFQIFNAVSLFSLVRSGDYEWQVPAAGAIFTIHAVGNFTSLVQTTVRKLTRSSVAKTQ